MVSRAYKIKKLARSKCHRLLKWEFWPVWIIYFPVAIYILYLGVKHRHFTLFTAANPGMVMGGVLGIKKSEILSLLKKAAPESIPNFIILKQSLSLREQENEVKNFVEQYQLSYPIVIKPDNGQRGEGVVIINKSAEITQALQKTVSDIIVQQYIPGEEFGVFVIKEPKKTAKIFSITHKIRPTVKGDGQRSLAQLILDDPRANLMAQFLLDKHQNHHNTIPQKDQTYPIVDLGTHCRGAVFKDANFLKTKELEVFFDTVLSKAPGLFFGRFDVRVPTITKFQQAENLSILEMNGVTSEAAHIYDPEASLLAAWKTLCIQWKYAFKIGKKNLADGAKTASIATILKYHHDHKQALRNMG